MVTYMLGAAILLPMLSGLFLLLNQGRLKNRRMKLLGIFLVMAVTAGIVGRLLFLEDYEAVLWSLTDTLKICVRMDDLTRLFAGMTMAAWVLAGVFSFEYMKHEEQEDRYFGFYLIVMGVLVALAGAYCLSGGEGEGFSMAAGDLLVICSAVFFSLHILVIDHFSPQVYGIQLSCVQFFVTGLISLALALVFEGLDWRALLAAWGPLLYTGVLSSGVAYTLQIVGQKGTNPTVASLLMSLESVFAAVSGWVLLGEPLSPRELVGCGLVFTAVILAQLPSRAKGAGAQ